MTFPIRLGPALVPKRWQPKRYRHNSRRDLLRHSCWITRASRGGRLWWGWSPFTGTVWLDPIGTPRTGRSLTIRGAARRIRAGREH